MKQTLAKHKTPVIIAGLTALVLLGIVCFFGWERRDYWLPELIQLRDAGLALLRSVHPVTFFILLCVLPVVPVPIMPFYLTAGIYPLWVAVPGLLIGISCNLALSYWLAVSFMRPLALRMLQRWNFRLPQVTPKNEKLVNIVVRVSGLPYAAQNYVCALSGVSFKVYMMIGVPLQMAAGVAFMLVGDSLMNGHIGKAIMGVSLLIILGAATKMVKDRLEKRKKIRAESGASV